ncbi:sulfate permease [Planoprotostelium fungivorum]|uniref:Sulfate permease n=1 Tax=Planoprotostelium fungivorum TaxID=1890364 RepID=A0A2P6NBK2_9EUKA|nr:sulfate permease [Planoprotostelium fungivorum]
MQAEEEPFLFRSGPRFYENTDTKRVLQHAFNYTTSCLHNLPSSIPTHVLNTFPILKWGRRYQPRWLLGDLIAGITVGVMIVPQGLAYAKVRIRSDIVHLSDFSWPMCPSSLVYTVGVMIVPQGLAYAKLANVPVEFGLYSAYLACLLYVLVGTSRDVSLGPTAVVCYLTGNIVTQLNSIDGLSPAVIATSTAFISGMFLLAAGIFRLGIILDFMSAPVLSGYTLGASLGIAVTQLPEFLGIHAVSSRQSTISIFQGLAEHSREINWADFGFGIVSLFLLSAVEYLKRKYRDRVWVKLLCNCKFAVVLSVSTLVSYLICRHQSSYPIAVLGVVPEGLKPPTNPTVAFKRIFDDSSDLIVLLLATVLEHIAIARALARKGGYRISTDQELFALGFVNMIGSIFGATPMTGGFSSDRSAIQSQAGVNSPLTGIFSGLIVIAALLFLTPLFHFIPQATLAAIIIGAVINLVITHEVTINLWRVSFFDLVASTTALLVTFFVGVEIGILSAAAISISVLFYQIARPKVIHIRQLENIPHVCVQSSINDKGMTWPAGIIVLRIEGPLVFPAREHVQNCIMNEIYKWCSVHVNTTADNWSEDPTLRASTVRTRHHRVMSVVEDLPPLRSLVLDMSAVTVVDASGLMSLFEVVEQLKGEGRWKSHGYFMEIHLVAVRDDIRRKLSLARFGESSSRWSTSSNSSRFGRGTILNSMDSEGSLIIGAAPEESLFYHNTVEQAVQSATDHQEGYGHQSIAL